MKKIVLTTALLAGVLAQAGGFRVSLQGVKQLAMAHTSAHAEDASVTFFNPAGMSFIPAKLSIAAGGFGAKSSVTYQNLSTLESFDTDNPLGTPLYGAVAYKVLDNVSVGFNFSTPFGSTIEWPSDWAGREIVQRLELKAYYFQPMVSFKLAPWASVGGSYIYAKGTVNWDKAVTQLGGSLNLLDEKQNEINGLLLDYEAEKAKYKIVKQEVVKTVEKIVERPVYQNDCFDQDGVDALNKLIGAKS